MTRKPGASADRQTFPKLREDPGVREDPARFLDHDLVGTEWSEIVESRIRGIDRIRVARAWIAVERALGRGSDDGPRDAVIEMLEDRIAFLQEHGERPRDLRAADQLPDRYYPGARPDPDEVELETNLLNGEPFDEVDRSAHMRSSRDTLDRGGRR
jgi:hypothetical protein